MGEIRENIVTKLKYIPRPGNMISGVTTTRSSNRLQIVRIWLKREPKKAFNNERGTFAFVCAVAFVFVCFRMNSLGWQGLEDGNHLDWRIQAVYVFLGLFL